MILSRCPLFLSRHALLALGSIGLLVSGLHSAAGQDGSIDTAAELIQVRRHHDQTVWASEVLAQEHENTFVSLWDNLIHRQDKFNVLREFQFGRIRLPKGMQSRLLDHAITEMKGDESVALTSSQFVELVTKYEEAGYQIVETEWHHQAFQPPTASSPAESTVSVLIHATHAESNRRFIVRGNLGIRWKPLPPTKPGAAPTRQIPDTIDASGIRILSRKGEPAFQQAKVENFQCDQTGRDRPTTIHPVMIRDLDRDGLPEVIAGGFNRVYWNRGDWNFEPRKFCDFAPRHVNAGAMGDFDGDGIEDFIAAAKNDYVYFIKGERGGYFPNPGRPIRSIGKLRIPVAVAAGDIDGDGSLDLFIGQQKHGYQNGEIPTPYYDAVDSFPSFVLLNDGKGSFRNITSFAGLGQKSKRRNFSATFVDLDEDRDLDLLLTSDFSGTDLFLNDGNGGFTDATKTMRPIGYAFGMSHSFGDYNLDGQLDFITIGMSSTTARRLEKMGLGRDEFPAYNQARMKMGYGNRLFVRDGDGFRQADFNESCARTGWSWGSTTLDFDCDADPDIYIVNGQTSGKTTKDYCTRFWCHDIYYKEGERPDKAILELFGNMAPLFSGNAISWNGYEHNALLMNLDGNGFVNIGFLMDCSFEFDSRTALSGDLDADGRVDLLVEHRDIRNDQRNLHFVRNQWNDDNHWIGFRLEPKAGVATSPLGAKVVVTLDDGRKLVQHCLAGHSVWAQHLDWIHFGIGDAKQVRGAEIHWPGGVVSKVSNPAIDQYHTIQP